MAFIACFAALARRLAGLRTRNHAINRFLVFATVPCGVHVIVWHFEYP